MQSQLPSAQTRARQMRGLKQSRARFLSTRPIARAPIFVLLLSLPVSPVAAQRSLPPGIVSDSTAAADRGLISGSTLLKFGVAATGILAVVQFDEQVAQWARGASVQGNRSLLGASRGFRAAGDPGALILTAGLYGLGRLSGHPSVTDAGLHATEAVVISGATSGLIKLLAGRGRPNLLRDGYPVEFPEGTDEFRPLRGVGAYTSFPSGHTTVAFAAAASLTSELDRMNPSAARRLGPLLYGSAAAVGLSRIRDNQHWGSDVVAGAVIGTVVGRYIVGSQHRRSRQGPARWLVPQSVAPGTRGITLRWSSWFH